MGMGDPETADQAAVECMRRCLDMIAIDGTIVIGALLEHIEFAGVHSGDAAMVLPPHGCAARVSIGPLTWSATQRCDAKKPTSRPWR